MRVLQLGNVKPLPDSVVNYKVPGAATASTYTAPSASVGSKILNTINQLLPTVVQTKQTVDILRNKTTTTPGVINTTYAAQPAPAPTRVGLSTGAKVAIGVAAAAVVTGIIYAVTRKKKKKSGSLAGMKQLTAKNPTSGVDHIITFKQTNHSPGKIVILSDGRSVGKINKRSKTIHAPAFITEVVRKEIDHIVS